MFQINRTAVLAAALIVSLGFVPPINGLLFQGWASLADAMDGRPVRSALFIGNSRTFYNDMPMMVRSIADSAGYQEKFHIEMDAQPGVSLADHAENPRTQELIARGWDHVVLQVLSSDQYSADQASQVWEAAAWFIDKVRASGSVPAMFVTWRYTDRCTPDEGLPPSAVGLPVSGYANMHANIQQQHARLARTTGVDLVNVGLLWESLQDAPMGFSLYADCNHPSVYGSYMSALMFYSYFTGGQVAEVTFAPAAIAPEHALFIRTHVAEFLGQVPQSGAAVSAD